MDREDRERLREIARSQNRTFAGQLRHLISEEIARYDAVAKAHKAPADNAPHPQGDGAFVVPEQAAA